MNGGPMRWAAIAVLAIGAGFGASMAGPVWGHLGSFDDGTGVAWLPWSMALFFYGIPGLLITGVLVTAFVRMGLVSERDAIMTRMALGERRRDVLVAAAVNGARTGAVASAVTITVGLAIAQWLSTLAFESSSAIPGEPFLQWGAVVWSLAVLVGFTALAALCSAIAVAAVTRGTPDALAAASAAGTEVPRSLGLPTKRWHRVARAVPFVAFVLGMSIVALNRAVPLDAWALDHLDSPGWLMVTKNIGLMVAVVAAVWVGYHLLGWASERLVRTASAILGRGDATGGRAFAADGLARPTETRRRTLAVTAIVATVWAWAWGATGASEADVEAALALDADVIVTSVDPWAGPGIPTGLTQFGLDPELLEALTSDPDLRVISARVLIEDEATVWFSGDVERDEREVTYQPYSLVIDRTAADEVAPRAYRQLGLAAGVRLSGRDAEYLHDVEWVEAVSGTAGVGAVNTWIGSTPVYSMWADAPMASVDGDWARGIWGEAPVSALLVFGAHPDDQFGMPSGTVATAVEEAVGAHGAFILEPDRYSGWIALSSDGFVWVGLIGAVVIVALSAGVAHASAKSRRRELATFSALGASTRSLRAAPVWESAAITLCAALAGTVLGVALAAVFGNPFLLAPGAPFDFTEIAWHLGRDLATVPWGMVLGGSGLVVAAAAAVAWWMGRGMAIGTPVDELREAQKEGAR